MKSSRKQMALVVATALVGLAQAQAETVTISSLFTPLENLSAQDRIFVQKRVQSEHIGQRIDWENSIMGTNQDGQIEIRDKNSLQLQAVSQPTCVGESL